MFFPKQLQTSCCLHPSPRNVLLTPTADVLMLLSLVLTFLLVPTAELTTRMALLKCWWKH